MNFNDITQYCVLFFLIAICKSLSPDAIVKSLSSWFMYNSAENHKYTTTTHQWYTQYWQQSQGGTRTIRSSSLYNCCLASSLLRTILLTFYTAFDSKLVIAGSRPSKTHTSARRCLRFSNPQTPEGARAYTKKKWPKVNWAKLTPNWLNISTKPQFQKWRTLKVCWELADGGCGKHTEWLRHDKNHGMSLFSVSVCPSKQRLNQTPKTLFKSTARGR